MIVLYLIYAILTGQAHYGQESSITSVGPAEVTTSIDFPCGDDLCILIVDQAGVHVIP